MRNISLIDLKASYQTIREIEKSIDRIVKSGWYLFGPELNAFENELARYIGVKHAFGVHSGTDALTVSLKALGLGTGDEVIIPANVYPTLFGVYHSGVNIKLADVDPDTLNISLESIKKSVSKKTKAIIAVHLYGNPVDLAPIKKFAKDTKIYLIEDCAQAIGAEYKNKKVGSYGDISCFSFYPTKNLGAMGDGGAVVTNNQKIAEKVKLWRMYGEDFRYHSILPGLNSRLDEIQSAILRTQLRYLEKRNQKRQRLAKIYTDELNELPIRCVNQVKNEKSVNHLFVIRTEKREALSRYLKGKGIGTSVHYPIPVNNVEWLKYNKKEAFPVSEKSCLEVLSLPIYPNLKISDVKYVTRSVRDFFHSNS